MTEEQAGLKERVHASLWQIYFTIQATGIMPPVVTMALAWRHLTWKQWVKRILIAIGIFWAFNVIVGAMIILGYLPAPAGFTRP